MKEKFPHPETLRDRYREKLRESAVSQVYDLMRRHNVTVDEIVSYVAKKDPNRAPLERIREYKSNNGNHKASTDNKPESIPDTDQTRTSINSGSKATPKTPSGKTIVVTRPNP